MRSSLFQLIGEFLFPSFCCHCHQFGPYLCADCYELLHFYVFPVSLDILKKDQLFLESVTSAVEYDRVIGSVLHYLKYKHAKEVGLYLADFLYFTTFLPNTDLITSVPLHPMRQYERGYNQSEIIAKRLSKFCQQPYHSLLVRTKLTASQASLKLKSQRMTNLQDIFAYAAHSNLVVGKRIMLIDDVCTTGTTLNECAKILKEHGAKAVFGVTIAHGS